MDILIIEDEDLLARRLIRLMETAEPNYTIAGVCRSINDAVTWLRQQPRPGLIFMDIELADGQCFDIFNQVKVDTPVIFTTAYDEYTLQAFRVNSVDYLLKPINAEDLRRALDKFKSYHHQADQKSLPLQLEKLLSRFGQPAPAERLRFLVKKGQKMIPVEVTDVGLFTIRHGVCFLVTKEKQKFAIEYNMDEVESMLDSRDFFRVNRQFILSNSIVQAVIPWFNSRLKLEISLPVDEDIIVSREKASSFKEWMGA